jgi:hypothetical protein
MQLTDVCKLLSETEVEKATGGILKRRTLQHWRLIGGGPKFVKVGRRCYYHPDAIAEFIGGAK